VKREFDILFVGTGLAAGLAALRLSQNRPNLRIGLLDSGLLADRRSPTWSFHETDLDAQALRCVEPVLSASWSSYDVAFPEHRRTLRASYHSILAADFFSHLKSVFADTLFENQTVVEWARMEVRTADGNTYCAPHIMDSRGWAPVRSGRGSEKMMGTVGYQKFLGLDLKLQSPHGLSRPIVMDATVDQIDGYRFVYVLPWSENELLVEDTRYTLDATLDTEAIRAEVLKYAAARSWKVQTVVREETGCLPIPFSENPTEIGAYAVPWGVRAGLFHPTTGYSFPFAMESAGWLSQDSLKPGLMTRFYEKKARVDRRLSFYRWLNRVFFWQKPDLRYRMLQRFYRLPEPTIARFYSATLRPLDYIRFFSGKPPVPPSKALEYLFNSNQVRFTHGC
jgi:lycopene beta-cyclase